MYIVWPMTLTIYTLLTTWQLGLRPSLVTLTQARGRFSQPLLYLQLWSTVELFNIFVCVLGLSFFIWFLSNWTATVTLNWVFLKFIFKIQVYIFFILTFCQFEAGGFFLLIIINQKLLFFFLSISHFHHPKTLNSLFQFTTGVQ